MASGYIRDIHVPNPTGGEAVQIGCPVDLSGNPRRIDGDLAKKRIATMPSLKTLFLETRPHYLLLSILLVMLGASIAGYYGSVAWGRFALCLAGLILLHSSANVLNDYFDFSSGIDLATQRTPFNGGSGLLNQALLTQGQALAFGLSTFVLAIPIGCYLWICA